MRVAIEKIQGVREVEVTLADGLARIELEPGNRVSVERIRRAIRDGGFTPKDARVVVAGRLEIADGRPRLAVGGLDETLPLLPGPEGAEAFAELEHRRNTLVVVEGLLTGSSSEEVRPALLLQDVRPASRGR